MPLTSLDDLFGFPSSPASAHDGGAGGNMDDFFKPSTTLQQHEVRLRRPQRDRRSSLSFSDEGEEQVLRKFVSLLKQRGYRMVAFDFDDTIAGRPSLSPVSGDDVASLVERVTGLFRKLTLLLLSANIEVVIVTFNTNPNITKALNHLLREDNNVIPVYARQDSHLGTGKTWHLLSAMSDLDQAYMLSGHDRTHPSEVLLFDDDSRNVWSAKQLGFDVVCNPGVIRLQDLKDWITRKEATEVPNRW